MQKHLTERKNASDIIVAPTVGELSTFTPPDATS